MKISDLFSQSFRAISAHKKRNFFSTFGIAWGVAAFLILAGWGVGLKQYMKQGMNAMGEDIIFVFPGHTSMGVGGYRAGRQIFLYPEDVEVIEAYASKLRVIIPVDYFNLPVSRGNKSEDRELRGVMPDARTVRNLSPERGRFITPDDIKDRRRVCVLGPAAKEAFFDEDEDALGEEIRIGGVRFAVVGVLPEKFQMSNVGTRDDDLILIPFSTGRSLFSGRRPLWAVMAKAYNPDQYEEAMAEIRKALAPKYD
jgi:putative ABC transport system permease protein